MVVFTSVSHMKVGQPFVDRHFNGCTKRSAIMFETHQLFPTRLAARSESRNQWLDLVVPRKKEGLTQYQTLGTDIRKTGAWKIGHARQWRRIRCSTLCLDLHLFRGRRHRSRYACYRPLPFLLNIYHSYQPACVFSHVAFVTRTTNYR